MHRRVVFAFFCAELAGECARMELGMDDFVWRLSLSDD